MGRVLQIAGLAVGVFALACQFSITIPLSMQSGRGLAASLVFFFSFFTILVNSAAVLVYSASLRTPRWLAAFSSPTVRAGVAVCIAAVMITYHVVLAGIWQPQGLFLLCDVLLHYVTPTLYLAWWLAAGADGSTRWSDIPRWLVFPLLYLVYALARGAVVGEVPYPFLDVAANGAGGVALASLTVFGLFLVLSVGAILADRAVSRFRKPSANRTNARS